MQKYAHPTFSASAALPHLFREHTATLEAMLGGGLGELDRLGIDGKMMVHAGLVGRVNARFSRGQYEPDESGVTAYQVPATSPCGELIDLVAWPANNPRRWASRLGLVSILGESAVWDVIAGGTLCLWRTPLEWVRNRAQGAVILRREGIWRELGHLESVSAADLRHGEAVARALTPPQWRGPKVAGTATGENARMSDDIPDFVSLYEIRAERERVVLDPPDHMGIARIYTDRRAMVDGFRILHHFPASFFDSTARPIRRSATTRSAPRFGNFSTARLRKVKSSLSNRFNRMLAN